MRREVPEPWASAMLAAGFEYAKRPSIRALARRADIPSSETVRQMIHGESNPDPATVAAVATALGKPETQIRRWVGQAQGSAGEWIAPDEVRLLTDVELAAITDLIKAIAAPRKRRDILVIAGTGSGKTESFVQQWLSAANEVDDLDNVESLIAARRAELMVSPGAAEQDRSVAADEDQRPDDERSEARNPR